MSDLFRDYSFGGWLKTFRTKREITLREMCRRLEMDPGNYSKMERSQFSPPKTMNRIRELGRVLKLNESELEMLFSTAYSWHQSRLKAEFECDAG